MFSLLIKDIANANHVLFFRIRRTVHATKWDNIDQFFHLRERPLFAIF